jgi:nitrite reductase/ring-hydroxylating ferredoxin subunit
MAENFVRVASVSEVPDGEMIPVIAGTEQVLLANVGGRFFAIATICSHEWAYLGEGWLRPETLQIECPLHGGHFDLETGAATVLPADEPVPVYAVKVEGDEVFVAVN